MDHQEKGTAVGATGGALVGAAVGGPVGAAVGAGVGGYAGHYETKPGGIASSSPPGRTAMNRDADQVRAVQRALNDRGYSAGNVDGVYGASTEDAMRRFQQASGLPQSGAMDDRSLSALGVSH
jgi:peptidoglycan hydrolase-like protein with peptidoglycan-binding domain